jgi:ADP-heptose:LPS heptosyltransferase
MKAEATPAATVPFPSPTRILVLSQCALGDTLVMLPALRVLRYAYPEAFIAFLSEEGATGRKVTARDVLDGTGLVDEFHALANPSSPVRRLALRLGQALRLRRGGGWDLGIVLLPPVPPLTAALVRRLSFYLRLFGARRRIAPREILPFRRDPEGWLAPLPHVADLLLGLLRDHGLPPAAPGDEAVLLPVPADPAFTARAEALFPARQTEGRRDPLRLAVAPGAQMPSKRWSLDRYAELLGRLRETCDPLFVLFGGDGDRPACSFLEAKGLRIAQVISQPIPVAAAAMRQCDAYVGNDTGVMHLAVACGKPCVAVFSSRDAPGSWYPYGHGHTVFRTRIACEGCLSFTCPRGDNACLEAIRTDAVLEACLRLVRAAPGLP